jgi:threonine dehydratase
MASPAPLAQPEVTLADVEAAAARIQGAVVRTPTMLSRTLSDATGATIWVKFVNLQFSAAY